MMGSVLPCDAGDGIGSIILARAHAQQAEQLSTRARMPRAVVLYGVVRAPAAVSVLSFDWPLNEIPTTIEGSSLRSPLPVARGPVPPPVVDPHPSLTELARTLH